MAHATNYRARPGDGARRAVIYLDKKALQGYDVAKRRLHLSDGAGQPNAGPAQPPASLTAVVGTAPGTAP